MLNTTRESNTASLPPPMAADVEYRGNGKQVSRLQRQKKEAEKTKAEIDWRIPAEAGACLAISLRERWRIYRKQLRQCQKDFSESSVHELRVATRRLMTQCILVDGTTSGGEAEKARRRLKRRLKTLGELRDTQVQSMFVEGQLLRFPGCIEHKLCALLA